MSTPTPPSFASKDTLDPQFGSGGTTVTRDATRQLTVVDMALTAAGEILLAVDASDSTGSSLLLMRYDAHGAPDTRFGDAGIVTTAFQSSGGSAFAISVLADGKIVLVGDDYNGKNLDFALVQYGADGRVDTDFATAGRVDTAFGQYDDRATAVAVQTDGRIVVVGHSFNGSQDDFAVARYLPTGVLDSSFANAGKTTVDFRKAGDGATAVALQTDGKILIAGHSFNSTRGDDFGLVRLNVNGTFDSSFGSGGGVTTNILGGNDVVTAIAVQSDGKIVLAGRSFTGLTAQAVLVRYLNNGTLDTGFGSNGIVTTSLMDTATDVIIRPDGKLVMSGSAQGDFALIRLNGTGQIDTTFGTEGVVKTGQPAQIERINRLAVQDDGKLLAVGHRLEANQSAVVLQRYGWDVSLSTLQEDDTNPQGSTFKALYETVYVDADANAYAGVALSARGVHAEEGDWQYSTDDGAHWFSVGVVDQNTALLLGRETRIRFVPAHDYAGTPTALNLHLVDDSAGFTFTQGANRATVSLTSAQAISAISTQSSDLSLRVLAVNDAPVLTRITPFTGGQENQAYTLNPEDLPTHSDVYDADGDTLVFRIDRLLSGQLSLNGQAVIEGVTTLTAGSTLLWTPPAGANGNVAVCTVVAVDPSGSSSQAATVTVQLAAVNDPPHLSRVNVMPGGIEDTPYRLTYDDVLNQSDASDPDGDAVSFRIEAIAAGSVFVNDRAVIPGSTRLNPGDTLSGLPPTDANGLITIGQIVAIDPSGAVSATPIPLTLEVLPVNDAPTLSRINRLSGATEDTPFSISLDTLRSASDAHDADGDALVFRVVDVISGTLTEAGNLIWTPPRDANGILTAFTVEAVDPSGSTSDPVAVQVVVSPVDDPPVLTRIAPLRGGVEDQPYRFAYPQILAASDAYDPDGEAPVFQMDAAVAGRLSINGVAYSGGARRVLATDALEWQPPENANGILTALTLGVVDAQGREQGPPQPLTIELAAVNDPPRMSRIDVFTDAQEDTPYVLTYAQLRSASDAHDVDGDALEFRVAAVQLTDGASLIWTPPRDANGVLTGFNLELWDTVTQTPVLPALPVKFRVAAINDPPVITLPTTPTPVYTEGGVAVQPCSGLELTDVDTARMDSATIRLIGFNPLDRLTVNTGGTPVSASYQATTGTLQLSGGATLATYQNLLKSLSFTTAQDVLKPELRRLELTVSDGTQTSLPKSQSLTLMPSVINGTDGADTLIGTAANDVINAGAGDDWLDGKAGADRMTGGAGNDTYIVDNTGEVIREDTGAGTDRVISTLSWGLGPNLEELVLGGQQNLSGTGNSLNNRLYGNAGRNRLSGMGGRDTLIGNGGADTLAGGADVDTFVYLSLDDSRPGSGHDLILDFNRKAGERIDLTALDANSLMAGHQAFSWRGTAPFTAPGQIRYVYEAGRDTGTLTADTDGDRLPDLEIELIKVKLLTAADLLM
ncbi:MAG: cadherin-like domain-containing protein [Methylococcaceae bacterium]